MIEVSPDCLQKFKIITKNKARIADTTFNKVRPNAINDVRHSKKLEAVQKIIKNAFVNDDISLSSSSSSLVTPDKKFRDKHVQKIF